MKYIALLSSGLDSTVNIYWAHKKATVTLALTLDYGQRSAVKEISNAKKICDELKIPHKTITVDFFKDFTKTSLINTQEAVPKHMQIDDLSECQETAKAVWVPNRNGIFINIAAGFAEGLGVDQILVGFNKEEGATFLDNTQAYLDRVNESLEYSTRNKVKVTSFTTAMNKTDIVREGRKLNVNFDFIWSCYFANDTACGECESCLRLQRALKDA